MDKNGKNASGQSKKKERVEKCKIHLEFLNAKGQSSNVKSNPKFKVIPQLRALCMDRGSFSLPV
jgi:hypothetical protein